MAAAEFNDSNTSLSHLKKIVGDFVQEREWEKFHAPKNISMALAIEAAELMEHFQWIGSEESRHLNEATRLEVGEELADVICYSLAMANQLNLDLTRTVINKMAKNCQKYPADEFRGRYRKS